MFNMVAERRSLILRGVLDICLLTLLDDGQPVYGYELTERLGAQGLLIAEGSTYPLLTRLEKAGLVRSERRPSPSGPPRKYYSITDQGRETLDSGRTEWNAVAAPVTALLNTPDASA
ncbi:PadR family transcriptional regulator PadR [Rhodococcus sp. SMB37]|nr:PadR family transcriptional regulator PadR [Rhodococcus sp. SMB37]